MWLGGFNDNNTPYKYDCQWVDCPTSRMTKHATDFDRTAATLGPWGSNQESGVRYGKCPIDSSYFSEADVQKLADCTLEAWNTNMQGQFMWTAHNELEARWDYV